MATTHPQTSKSQPWKANWPPAKQTLDIAGQKYMIDDAGALLVDGISQPPLDGSFVELACSDKDARHSYLVDGTGSLLIDGISQPPLDGSFVELACSNKDAGHTYLVNGTE